MSAVDWYAGIRRACQSCTVQLAAMTCDIPEGNQECSLRSTIYNSAASFETRGVLNLQSVRSVRVWTSVEIYRFRRGKCPVFNVANLVLKRFLILMAMASIGMCIARFCIMTVCLPSRLESFDPRMASIFADSFNIFVSDSDPGTLMWRADGGLGDIRRVGEVNIDEVEELHNIFRARMGRPLR